VLTLSTVLLNRAFDNHMDASVRTTKGIVDNVWKTKANSYMRNAQVIAQDSSLVSAVVANDNARARELAKKYMSATGTDLVTITDAAGNVVARAISDRFGDSISNQHTVRQAMKGETCDGIVTGTVTPFSIRGTSPIFQDGKVVGTVSLGVSMSNEGFVDAVKALTSYEFTIFKDDIRVMTTIKDGAGKRIIGTKLNNPRLEDILLKNGGEVYRDLSILDIPYKTAYWSIRDSGGKIVGVWFIGVPIETLHREQARAIYLVLGCAAFILVVLAGFSVWFGKRFTLPIRKVTRYAVEVADGHLDAELEVKSADETGTLSDALHAMVQNLKVRINEAETISSEAKAQAEKANASMVKALAAEEEARQQHEIILAATHKMEDMSNVLSRATRYLTEQIKKAESGANVQAERAAQSATAMTEMNRTVAEVASNAGNASEYSGQTRQRAMDGALVVEKVVKSIRLVQEDSLALKEDMTVLGGHAASISQIMDVISDIADQTNLLALNAAIEAARAGDAGRGFAVVADEVRKLAEKTMASTGDVGKAITAIRQSMEKSMTQMDLTVENIKQATTLAVQSGQSLHEIVQMADDTAGQVQAIAAASEEQSAASEEISRSVEEVNAIAEDTAKVMAGSTKEIAALAVQVNTLSDLIAEMKSGG
jgi:methyl-accepting chemotaxis protein